MPKKKRAQLQEENQMLKVRLWAALERIAELKRMLNQARSIIENSNE